VAEAFEAFKPERKPGDERVFQTTKQPLNRKFRHVSEDERQRLARLHTARCVRLIGVGRVFVITEIVRFTQLTADGTRRLIL
jgi:hypothetical protein